MRRLLAAVLAPLLALPAAELATLDGDLLRGALHLEADAALLDARRVALADADWLRLDDGPLAEPAAWTGLGAWLVDGSWLPAERLTAAPSSDAVRIIGPFGQLDLPLAALLGWCEDELPPAADSDHLTVAAGPLDGRVRGVRDGRLQVATSLDPQPLSLAIEDVRSLRLAQAARTAPGPVLLAVLDPRRPPLRLAAGAILAPAAAPAAAIDPAPLAGRRLQVAGNRRVWLSDLRPAAVQEDGAFGVVWPWKADTDLDGAPLRLGGRRWAKGISVHSRARLAWRLDGAYLRLRALAGIADALGQEGDCTASLAVDGTVRWQRASVAGGDAPIPIAIDLTGGRELELRVDYGARYDIGDHFTLADAWLVRR